MIAIVDLLGNVSGLRIPLDCGLSPNPRLSKHSKNSQRLWNQSRLTTKVDSNVDCLQGKIALCILCLIVKSETLGTISITKPFFSDSKVIGNFHIQLW